MVKWHVSPDGVARKCSARVKNCEYTHAENEQAAYELNEKIMAEEGHDSFSTIQKLENPNDPSVRNQFVGRDLSELINVQKVYINDYTGVKNEIEALKATRSPGALLPKETLDKIQENEKAQAKILKTINKVGYAIDLADGTRSAEPKPIKFADQKLSMMKLYLENQSDKFRPLSNELLEVVNNSKNNEETLQTIARYVDSPAVNQHHEFHHEQLRNYIKDDSYYE